VSDESQISQIADHAQVGVTNCYKDLFNPRHCESGLNIPLTDELQEFCYITHQHTIIARQELDDLKAG